jgi:hypothetical protein
LLRLQSAKKFLRIERASRARHGENGCEKSLWLICTSSAKDFEQGDVSMQEYDLYINPKKPSIGLYVRKGAGLPDLADASEWLYDGSANDVDLSPDLVRNIETTGHALRELD